MKQQLPIDQVLPELTAAITAGQNVILHAPPGAGKTTRVPMALLELFPPEAGRIIMLEPRRLAAISAARWMAASLGEEVGRTVGYSIRFDSRVSRDTRIEVVTEGILTRRLQSDPLLEGIAVVIFDEFHERSIHADLGLALCLDVQAQVRNDLRILVMSATLECEPLSQLMQDATMISSAGTCFPVEDVYLEERGADHLPRRMAAAVQQALKEREGDILVFLPGAGEIGSCAQCLSESGLVERGVGVHQLYGDLPFDTQQAAIQPGRQRKVVLATSIAETSLTIEGVRVVIDSGLSRRVKHDLASGMNRMVTVRASRASALQRRGRAGRLAPGVCYRLYSRHTFSAMTPHTPPEILETDLAPLVLELAAWGIADPAALAWLDVPPEAGIAAARCLLQQLDALDENNRITALGRSMSSLPLHPRLSRLLLRAVDLGCTALGCDLAALLSERDIIRRSGRGTDREYDLDLRGRVEMLREWRSTGRAAGADSGSLKSVDRVARHLQRLSGMSRQESGEFTPDDLCRLLLAAYPDRVARRRDGEAFRYLLSNGRGASLAGEGRSAAEPLLIATSVDGGNQAEGVIHMAAALPEELLRDEAGHKIEQRDSIVWDEREGRITASREEFYGALRLSGAPYVPQAEIALPVVIAALRRTALGFLSRPDAFYQLQARVHLVRGAYPSDGWPDLCDASLMETLEEWLAPHLVGKRTAQQLASVDCATALLGLLDYRQRQSLDHLAPTHLVVPSGSRVRLDYCSGEVPVLAVKLQELFGLAESPTVAGGRVGVLLHLLSPAGRPLQVTRDLKGFWDGSYHQVKKEMKGRYPKHPWPDDPWSAPATRRVKSKMER